MNQYADLEKQYKITSRQIFNTYFLTRWEACLSMALERLKQLQQEEKIDFTMADLLSATAHLFICWNQNSLFIENKKLTEQKKLDDKMKKK